jgi:hypothetical protein
MLWRTDVQLENNMRTLGLDQQNGAEMREREIV